MSPTEEIMFANHIFSDEKSNGYYFSQAIQRGLDNQRQSL